jgi:hypothetical protein
MSDDNGPVKMSEALFEATDEDALRAKREEKIVASIEARLRAGEITVREADAELMKLVLADFKFFSESTQAKIRAHAEAQLDENPEMVESRPRIAAHYGAETGDDEGSA